MFKTPNGARSEYLADWIAQRSLVVMNVPGVTTFARRGNTLTERCRIYSIVVIFTIFDTG